MYFKIVLIAIIAFVFDIQQVSAYSVLTHEAIIDAAWEQCLVPALKQRYPKATAEELQQAHAYAYGGAVAPDMGYFPMGSKLFTNLVHYVRSGDFVTTLLNEEQNINEYAFALGFLAHYNADRYGHPYVNRSEPLVYPKMRKEFGDTITYAETPVHHVMMEFGFDVLQTSRGNYTSQAYHDLIGFKVADSLLVRTFPKVYGLNIDDIFRSFPRAINTFRWSVKNLIPELTRSVWAAKREDIRKTTPGITRRSYIYRVRRVDYYKEYGKAHDKPGIGAHAISFFIRVMPKVGPFKKLKFTTPGPEAEKLFVKGFDTVLVHYITAAKTINTKKGPFTNIDFDTGNETEPGEYVLADDCYADLLLKLQEHHFDKVNKDLKQNIIAFYDHPAAAPAKQCTEIVQALDELKTAQLTYSY